MTKTHSLTINWDGENPVPQILPQPPKFLAVKQAGIRFGSITFTNPLLKHQSIPIRATFSLWSKAQSLSPKDRLRLILKGTSYANAKRDFYKPTDFESYLRDRTTNSPNQKVRCGQSLFGQPLPVEPLERRSV